MKIRLNKYPFFLWLTQRRDDFKVDLNNNTVSSEELGKSSIKKIHFGWVILMRYIPLICLSYFFFIPRNTFEIGLFFIALFTILVLFALLNYEVIFKAVILGICIMNFYFVFKIDGYAPYLSTTITLFVETLMFAVILYDVLILKGYENWYFLESFKNEINIKVAQKKEKKFLPFFKKRNFGFNISKTISLRGYFLRIQNEDNN